MDDSEMFKIPIIEEVEESRTKRTIRRWKQDGEIRDAIDVCGTDTMKRDSRKRGHIN